MQSNEFGNIHCQVSSAENTSFRIILSLLFVKKREQKVSFKVYGNCTDQGFQKHSTLT